MHRRREEREAREGAREALVALATEEVEDEEQRLHDEQHSSCRWQAPWQAPWQSVNLRVKSRVESEHARLCIVSATLPQTQATNSNNQLRHEGNLNAVKRPAKGVKGQ